MTASEKIFQKIKFSDIKPSTLIVSLDVYNTLLDEGIYSENFNKPINNTMPFATIDGVVLFVNATLPNGTILTNNTIKNN